MMEVSDDLRPKVSIEMSSVLLVKNRCQFCYAFFKDPEKIAVHSRQCEFRFSETFEAFDGKVKFACAVCFDVFQTRTDHRRHERLHKFPGGFPCSICDKIFLNDFERTQHLETVHEAFTTGDCSAFTCFNCDAFFEHKNYLRLHNETKCGRYRSWSCIQCNLLTENAYKVHMKLQHKFEEDESSLIPKVEVELNKAENINSTENIAKMDSDGVETSNYDPLLVLVKEEPFSVAASQSICDDGMHDISVFAAKKEREEKGDDEELEENLPDDERSDGVQIKKIVREKRRNNNGKYACKYCGKTYAAECFLNKHIAEHGPDGSLVYKCDCCLTYFESARERKAHRQAEHEEMISCKKCGKTFGYMRNLYAHIRIYHREEKMEVTCQKCGIMIDEVNLKCHQESCCVVNDKASGMAGNSGQRSNEATTNKSRQQSGLINYKCNYCGQRYFSKDQFDKHIVVHGRDGSLVHKCECCSIYFKTAEERNEHRKTAHEENLTCKICAKLFQSIKALNGHIGACHKKPKTAKHDNYDQRSHTENESSNDNVPKKRKVAATKFECKYCGKKYLSVTALDKHIFEHGPDGRLVHKCDRCSIYFETTEKRDEHLMNVHKEELTCTDCHKFMPTLNQLLKHNRHCPQKIGSDGKFICVKCGASYTMKISLEYHERSDCGRLPTSRCDECGKCYATNHSLNTHKKTMHSNEEKQFTCTVCKKRFRTRAHLKAHKQRHTGEKRFQCDHCKKRFTDMGYMKAHMAMHGGIKRHVCYGCGDRFMTNSALHKHRKYRKDSCALVPIKPQSRRIK